MYVHGLAIVSVLVLDLSSHGDVCVDYCYMTKRSTPGQCDQSELVHQCASKKGTMY